MFKWIAFLVALLIVLAFFWPQQKTTIKNDAAQLTQQVGKTGKTKISRDTSFSKRDDNSRAQSFRDADEFDRKIRVMVNEAQTLFDKQHYTLPQDKNALIVYQEILTLSSNNVAARQGIENILDALLNIGKNALKVNKLTTANRSLQKLIKIDEESSQTIILTSDISVWHQNKKRLDILNQADQAFKDGNYISPATQNALYYYEQALTLYPDNNRAKNGIQNIINVYLSRTQNAIKKGQLSNAITNIEILSEIDPDYPLILGLKNDIQKAKEELDSSSEQLDSNSEELDSNSEELDSNSEENLN